MSRLKRPAQLYTSKSARQVYKHAERQQDSSGKWWIAPRVAAARTGHINYTLHAWSKKGGTGCPLLDGERLDRQRFRDGHGRSIRFYREEQINRLAETELSPVPHSPGYVTRNCTFRENL